MQNKKTQKNILKFSPREARAFFLQGENYCNFDLPPYFDFDPLLEKVSQKIGSRKLSDFHSSYPGDSEDVNYKLINNKDGKYSWRPFQLIHPALYVELVNVLTSPKDWKLIVERFDDFTKNDKIKCLSLPIRPAEHESSRKTTIINWWEHVEQYSLELAMEYQYLIHTDITDCYGSFYTHSVAWAVHGKELIKKKENRRNGKFLGNKIDDLLRWMSFGQTNGIPQGSVLMDFIAEIVLGYADLLLNDKMNSTPTLTDYQILRYRDDYRIFTNNPQDGELIVKYISEVLLSLGLKLHPMKTLSSGEAIRDSLKEDKRYWVKQKRRDRGIQKHLLIIHDLAQEYPNSGSLVIALHIFYRRVNKIKKFSNKIIVLISVVLDIAFKNPRTYPQVSAILSKLVSLLPEQKTKLNIIKKIQKRFEKIPNTGHLDIWLQRMTYKIDSTIKYEEPLCGLVVGDDAKIWNSDWLNSSIKKLLDPKKVIDQKALREMSPIIESDEFDLFNAYVG